MKLYFSPGACSLSPHIALHELGLDHSLVRVDLAKKVTETGADFRAINPRGQVPTLELDDGTVLTEGPAIVQYLADRKPDSSYMPKAGTIDRTRAQGWLNYVSTELHKSFSPLFRPNTPDEYKTIVRGNLANHFTWLDGELSGRPYLMGDTFTAPDAYLFVVSNWAKLVGVDIDGFKNVTAFRDRVGARPAVQAAMKDEGLIK
ncbi:MAG: glutathione transferase GstA [Beijerinckiaceae bacterium]